MHYLIQPGPALPDRFAYLIGGLCHCLGAIFTRDRTTGLLTLAIHRRLRRLQERFARIVARVEAGKPALVRGRAGPRRAGVRAPSLTPRAFGWLCRLMPEGNVYATNLEQQFLNEADTLALLAKAPQVGEVMRSVLWMMGRPVPEALRRPKAARPKHPKPRNPPASAEPVAQPGTPYREQPPMSHWPRSIWPTKADCERTGRRLAREARRQISAG